MQKSFPNLLPALVAILFIFVLPRAHGAEAAGGEAKIAAAEKILQTILKAVLADDYPAFLAPGTKDLSRQISEHRFAQIREDVVPALKNGYTVAYDIEVTEPDGATSYHWKITPRKGDTELRAILIMKGGRVQNLSIQ